MHDAFGVQVADREADLERVELDNGLWQSLVGFEYFVKFAATDEGHHEVESRLTLEKVVHSAQERVIAAKKDVFFKTCVLHLLEVEEHVLSDGFDRVLFARSIVFKLCKEDFAEGTFT